MPTDPPLVMLLNKVFEALHEKLQIIREIGPARADAHKRPCSPVRVRGAHLRGDQGPLCTRGVALVVTATPRAAEYEHKTGVRTRFLPYAASEAFGAYYGGTLVDGSPRAAERAGGSQQPPTSSQAWRIPRT